MSTTSILATVAAAILSGGVAGGLVRGQQEKAADLRSRRIEAALEFLVPLGAARVALLSATEQIRAWGSALAQMKPDQELSAYEGPNAYEASSNLGYSLGNADGGLDDAQMHTTRMAILFSKRSNVETAANEALLAYRRWHDVMRDELPLDRALKTNADALTALRKAAQQAERAFKDGAADAVQRSVRSLRR